MSEDSIDKQITGIFGEVNETKQETDNAPPEDPAVTIIKLREQIAELEERLVSQSVCLRCGRDPSTAPLKVSDQVTEEYFRCLLGQKPFEKTFKLFDGRLLLTFRELSGGALLTGNQSADQIEQGAGVTPLDMYLLTGMLTEVSVFDPRTMITQSLYHMTDEQLIENMKDPKKAYDNLVDTVGQLKIAVIRRTCATFEYLLTALIEKGQDENFYEDAGLL